MRVTKGLFFVLAALVGIFALATPAYADACTNPDQVKFKDGVACVTDLTVKWNELVTTLILVNNQLHVASDNIESACSDLGVEDECWGGSVTEPDFGAAQAYTDDAVEDVSLALSYIESANGVIADFQDELAGLTDKLDGAGTDYGFGDRNRTSAGRTAALISSLMDKVTNTLGDETAGTGVAGALVSASTDLADASAELGSEGADEDVASELLDSALGSVNTAALSKDRTLRKHLSQVKRNLDKLKKLFYIAQNNPKRASEGVATLSNANVSIYTMSGQLVNVSSSAALDRTSLANGVYVVVYSSGRVEKLVVLH